MLIKLLNQTPKHWEPITKPNINRKVKIIPLHDHNDDWKNMARKKISDYFQSESGREIHNYVLAIDF